MSNLEKVLQGKISKEQGLANLLTDAAYTTFAAALTGAMAAVTGMTAGAAGVAAIVVATLGAAVGLEIPGLQVTSGMVSDVIDYFSPPAGGYTKEEYDKYLSVYEKVKEKLPPGDPTLSAAYDMFNEAGKFIYGEKWTPEDYGVGQTPNFDPQNINTWPPALLEALCKWCLTEDRGYTQADLKDFWKSEFCPPGLRETPQTEGDPPAVPLPPPGNYIIAPDNPGVIVNPETGDTFPVDPNIPAGEYTYDPGTGELIGGDGERISIHPPMNGPGGGEDGGGNAGAGGADGNGEGGGNGGSGSDGGNGSAPGGP